MQPFRTGPSAPPPCSQCGAARADLLNANGDVVCKACSVTGEADVRLARGRRSGTIGAIIGLVVGSGLVLASVAWLAAAFTHGGRRGTLRVCTFALCVGVLIVATCIRNLRRLYQ